jgi:argonaute-like protein implicated in RNA metabolism and viral defense
LVPHPSSDSTAAQIAEEVFSLTKINWNSTQMNQRLPVPIRAARKVGEVLKYLSVGQTVSSDYRRYI